jgi:hypothetical protein
LHWQYLHLTLILTETGCCSGYTCLFASTVLITRTDCQGKQVFKKWTESWGLYMR